VHVLPGHIGSTFCVLGLAARLLAGTPALAGEVTRFDIEHSDVGYHLQAEALIDAPRDLVRRILTDYAKLPLVSPRILESAVIAGSPPGITRVRTLNRVCFLVFCRNLRHVQLIRELGAGKFESTSVPAQSDLSYGHALWRLSSEGGATRLSIDFTFAINADGWLPAFVGLFIARVVLRENTEELIQGIERVAGNPSEQTDRH
jgi:hypothetical protein